MKEDTQWWRRSKNKIQNVYFKTFLNFFFSFSQPPYSIYRRVLFISRESVSLYCTTLYMCCDDDEEDDEDDDSVTVVMMRYIYIKNEKRWRSIRKRVITNIHFMWKTEDPEEESKAEEEEEVAEDWRKSSPLSKKG